MSDVLNTRQSWYLPVRSGSGGKKLEILWSPRTTLSSDNLQLILSFVSTEPEIPEAGCVKPETSTTRWWPCAPASNASEKIKNPEKPVAFRTVAPRSPTCSGTTSRARGQSGWWCASTRGRLTLMKRSTFYSLPNWHRYYTKTKRVKATGLFKLMVVYWAQISNILESEIIWDFFRIWRNTKKMQM